MPTDNENPVLELKKSEEFETKIFFSMAKELYVDCNTQCEYLYDIASKLTDNFNSITPQSLLEDSRIIKVLRYSLLPVVSQMKLGQLINLNTTAVFEDVRATTKSQLARLRNVADKLCEIINANLDTQRFLWLQTKLKDKELELASKYAKNWTCSLISNQNSNTAFRNWRKELQESAGISQIIKAGYTSVEGRPVITHLDDILPGQFVRETKIGGRNNQKSDITVRLKKSRRILCIEAKAIGVRVDAFKRFKECREKFDDWKTTFGSAVQVGIILSGFIPQKEYEKLLDMGITVFWEHNIEDLYNYVNEN